MNQDIPNDIALCLYETMLKIRKFEEAVVTLFAKGKIPGFLHTYVGEEAVATGICANLSDEDKIISSHRGHGHLIAKGGKLDLMMAELFAKRTGYNKGKGGSMHIAEPEIGSLGANAIVGAGIALINGAALTAQYLGKDYVSVCFFGDGASNTGSFHEALNLASVWNLPVIFVCENNRYADSTPQNRHQKITDIAVRAKAYDIPGVIVDGDDVGAVYLMARDAIGHARSGGGPTLLEAKTHRWHGHHASDTQFYRPKDELQGLVKYCPIQRWIKVLRDRNIPEATIASIEKKIDQEIKDAIAFAEESPMPDISEAYSDVFTPSAQEV
jgi:TPP-dependent pyruvate/acetoin dehydrogenase alpha subunit